MAGQDSNDPQGEARPSVTLVMGPSGAGRTTAIRVLEDLGYEVIDNLPLSLVPRLISGGPLDHPIALGIDVRNRDFSTDTVLALVGRSVEWAGGIEVLYLDCRPDVLVRRYSETRRRHPLAPDQTPLAGITQENEVLLPIREAADVLIDTSDMSPHELKAELQTVFDPEKSSQLSISVQSFSYKRGVPRGLDLVLDVRFLKNPHWEPHLRDMTGLNAGVADFVASDERFDTFFRKTCDLVEFLLPAYADEGKAHLAIGFGCTGGRHRSVTLAERMAKALADQGWQVSIRHRELDRLNRRGG